MGAMFAEAAEKATVGRSATFILFLLGMMALTFFIGQKLALPIFMFLYLIVWARYSLWVGLLYAFIGYAFLIILYDQIIHLNFFLPYLNDWLREITPERWHFLVV